jgi:hypothetical protein
MGIGCWVRCVQTVIFPRKNNVLRRFGSSRWRQVGVIIGVLGEQLDKIEKRWLGELDLHTFWGVLAGL